MNLIPKPVAALIWSTLALLVMPLRGAVVTANFSSATTVPVSAAGYTATGNTVNISLNFAPPVGTTLTVVNNTGLAFIQGTFDNLAQGQSVNLTYGGITYPFVANYFGGTGNDLVLQWANARLLAWGYNSSGQLGNGVTTNSSVPVAVDMTGVLAGKILLASAAGGNQCLAACADGTVVTWGDSSWGQAGNGGTTTNSVPVLVDQTGVLAGRTVVAVASGNFFCLALCADGQVAGWGRGDAGQLGNGAMSQSNRAVLVSNTGVLSGKTVVAIAAGGVHGLGLCADGTLVAWGANDYGQLGNNSTSQASTPVLVDRTGVLAGRSVVAIAAGANHSLALCADGTLAAWGNSSYGQLGNNSTNDAAVPVLVNRTGVLAGKTPSAIAAVGSHNLVLCSNGSLVTWGYNNYGQLGNNSNTQSSVPVAVDTSGVLAGKTPVGIANGGAQGFARCSDGSLAAWGYNNYGQLGNNSTSNSSLPVSVSASALQTGERFAAMSGGAAHCLAMAATPPPPVAVTLAATAVTDTSATLNGSVSAEGNSTGVSFEYGPTPSYGFTATATPATLTGTAATAVAAPLGVLLSGTTYHFRVVATSLAGTVKSGDLTFTTSAFASLASLTVSSGELLPAFDSKVISYSLAVPFATTSLALTPVVLNSGATVKVNAVPVASGSASGPLALTVGNTPLAIQVTAAGGGITKTYIVTVTRLPAIFTYNSATEVPVAVADFMATGNTVSFTLNFAPPAGTDLSVVKNTGVGLIRGTFDNLAQGQRVNLTYGGVTYPFVANYFGGTGNDLVLQWASNRLLAWGANASGQLGLNHVTQVSLPTAVMTTGVLAGKSIPSVAVGGSHSLALCADGTLAAWGNNSYGQLGNNSNAQAVAPDTVDRSGVLAGKTVVAISAGVFHSLALCSDGTLAAWGLNDHGQLGNNSTAQSSVPMLVDVTGVLAGKSVVAIAAGYYFSLVLCSDGTLAAWGDNSGGQLGNNSTTQSNVPVAVDRSGVLAGKTVVSVAAGGYFNVALCSDGTLATWGFNSTGQLGIGKVSTMSGTPVAVDLTGVFAGKTPVAVAAGDWHCLVLCSDGGLVAWGKGDRGQLGNGVGSSVNPSPLLVTQTGVLAGKTVTSIAAGDLHSLARCSDGTLAAWGYNSYGQLGNNSTTQSGVPVLVTISALKTGERMVSGFSGESAEHNLAVVASVPPPLATTLAATGVADTTATLRGSVSANGSSTTVSFDYGLTASYGATITAVPANLTGTAATAASATPSGLLSGLTYHYRVVATSNGGTVSGDDMTFATSTSACLTNLTPDSGTLAPAFAISNTSYLVTVPNEVSSITLTPLAAFPTATVTVNGVAVVSGSASSPISLVVGNTTVSTVVTATGGGTKTYSVTATRLPASFTFSSVTSVPVTVGDFAATGNAPAIALSYTPDVGTNLTLVKNTGYNPIQGTFGNLAQGQTVYLSYGGMTYAFVANYFGGTGNDLVLQWMNNRLMVWGRLGFATDRIPVPVAMTGVLNQKTVTATATGSYHNLVLCSDGTLATWGDNGLGQLGNGSTTTYGPPALVDTSGVLAGKTVIAICSGYGHCLALCSDGTLAAWGAGTSGQLGNNLYANAPLPVLVNRNGALAGKTVIAIAAGGAHSLALCSDGSLAAWGANGNGQLGGPTAVGTPVPVVVSRSGGLAGKTVTAIAAGEITSMAVCSDGTLAAWGANTVGQLGNNTSADSAVPVAVDKTGVLAGKTIIGAAAGRGHGLALCADGTLATWGGADSGQLGNGSMTSSHVPVLVDRSGVLAGRTVTGISAGITHNLGVCSDGTLTAWGSNFYGELGNNSTTNSSVPVLSSTTSLRAGERFVSASSGDSYDYVHCIGIVASPPRPAATTLAATAITETGATLNAIVNPNATTSNLSFQYGLTQTYDTTVTPVPALLSGSGATTVSSRLEGLAFGTTYHYRVRAANANDTGYGDDMTFTTAAFATLSGLSLSQGTLVPAFSPARTDYYLTVPFATADLTVTPTAADAASSIQVNGAAVASGTASGALNLAVGNTAIRTLVTGVDPSNTKTYTMVVTRLPEVMAFQAATDVPVTVGDFAAAGNVPGFALNFTPAVGTSLTVVRNTGIWPIQGAFGNLAQGQAVQLTYAGVTYSFVADYFGGTGNDLVLQWANMKIWAWGANSWGQLGNNSTTPSAVPVPVVMNGVLAGKTVTTVAVGAYFSLALCVDGTVAAWGMNNMGAFGNGGASSSSGPLPVLTDRSGVLAGKRVTAVAAANQYSLALCSDGTLATWGVNSAGVLGNNSTASYVLLPVLVDRSGVLIKKSVIAISATNNHALVLCSDGTVAAWGFNAFGELGNNSLTNSRVPALVDMSGVLAGKHVTAISAGSDHSLVLCSDGTLAAWGYNAGGQLGNNSITNSSAPVLVDMTGVLAGKTVTAICAGSTHCLVLCSDGTLAAWGDNTYGEVGDNTTVRRQVPVRVAITGDLSAKSIRSISTGDRENLALFSDGTLATWGRSNGLSVPTPVSTSMLNAGEQIVAGFNGAAASHLMALSGAPPPPGAVTLAASGLTATGATLNGSVTATVGAAAVSFEYGLTLAYGTTLAAVPPTVSGATTTAVSVALSGLTTGATYHYRVVATGASGTTYGADMTFTTPNDNPDGDNYDNLIEYAFDLPPDSGAGSPFSLSPSSVSTGRVELGFTRPVGATASVTYYLEYSSALGAATSWISIPLKTISPRNIDISAIDDLTERVTVRNFEASEGFVRFRVELDANGDQITDHISYTGIEGWTESALDLGTRSYNDPYQHSAIFTGTVDSTAGVSGQTLHFTTSAGSTDLGTLLTPGASCYLEVAAGVNEGQRFDVVSATGSTVTLASDSNVFSDTPPFNTLVGAPPATLAGNRIAIHRHWTLGELFPVGHFFAANIATDADQVQTTAVAATSTYWLYSNGGSPKWVRLGDGTLADQASTVIAPGHGMLVTKRGIAAPVLAYGEVRANKFVRPLCAGLNLVGGGYPVVQSATGPGSRQMDVAHGFFGSTDPASADSFSIWKGDATPGASGYDNYYLYNPGTGANWVKTDDATLVPFDAEILFLGDRSALIQVKSDLHSYTIPNPSITLPSIAPQQVAGSTSWEQWQATELAGEPLNGPSDDPDHDGIPNLLEYVFGTPPLQAGTLPVMPVEIVMVEGQQFLQITIPRRSDHPALLTVEMSSDLANWNAGPQVTEVVSDDPTALVLRDCIPLGAGPRRFMRLRAELPAP